ncbi:hypothetical protein [Marinobacterium stanieri]|uniref:hypothetical protein n=1 Tax=Marinobacterium stanieri TaxID=49186 RepID=UPI0004976C88|nr:hypothetical protein [Marinobacterium stanieri]
MTTDTTTLIDAMRILANDIQSDDGVANAAIAEAAGRLEMLEAKSILLQNELDQKKLIHVGFTNGNQVEYAKTEEGAFYPDTDNDCWIPLYMLAVHAHRCGPDSETLCHLLELENRNREMEQQRDQLKAQWARFNSIMGEIHIECDTGDDYAGDPIPGELWQLWRSPETSLAAHDAAVIERAVDHCVIPDEDGEMWCKADELMNYANQLRQQEVSNA